MKYEEYEQLCEGVTSENALEIVTKILQKVKDDALEVEAEKVKLTEEMDAQKQKYQDLQVDYIHKFIGAAGRVEGETEEADTAAKLQEMTEMISETMNS